MFEGRSTQQIDEDTMFRNLEFLGGVLSCREECPALHTAKQWEAIQAAHDRLEAAILQGTTVDAPTQARMVFAALA